MAYYSNAGKSGYKTKKDEEKEKQSSSPSPKPEEPKTETAEQPKKKYVIPGAEEANRRGLQRTVYEHSKGVKQKVVKAGELDLPENLEKHRAHFEKQNKKGKLKGTGWATNDISVDVSSIKDIEQLAFYGRTLASDSGRKAVAKAWAKKNGMSESEVLAYLENRYMPGVDAGAFDKMQTDGGKLNEIGLYTLDGSRVDLGTAHPDTVVQAIRDIADADKRKSASKLLQSMTRDKSSRFYGYDAYSPDYSFRDSAVLTESGYKKYVSGLEGKFDPREEKLEQSLRTYLAEYEKLERQGGYILAQEGPALQAAFAKQMGVSGAPDVEQLRQMFAEAETADVAETPEESSTWDKIKAFWNDLKGKFTREEPEQEETGEEEPAPPAAGPSFSQSQEYPVRLVASSSSEIPAPSGAEELRTLTGPAPSPEPQEQTEGPVWIPGAKDAATKVQPTEAQGPVRNPEADSVNLTGDPIGALAKYVLRGNGAELDAETAAEVDRYARGSAEMKALLGILDDTNGVEALAGNRLHSNTVLENTGVLGPLATYAQKLHSKGFSADLSDEAVSMLISLVDEVTHAKLTDEESKLVEDGMANRAMLYFAREENTGKLAALDEAFAYSEEQRKAALQAQTQLAQETAQQALSDAQKRCRTGYATEADWEMVYANAPVVSAGHKHGDMRYREAAGAIQQGLDESYMDGSLDNWYNAQTDLYLRENGKHDDLTSKEAIVFKSELHSYMMEALGAEYDVAYALGYDDLGAYWAATGTGSMEAMQAKALALRDADLAAETAEDSPFKGEGDVSTGAVLWSGGAAGAIQHGAEFYEALATLGVVTDQHEERYKARTHYYSTGSFVDAEQRCRDDLYAMLEGGYFPNEEVAKNIKGYLDAGGAALDLGILPSQYGWNVAQKAAEKKQRYEDVIAWAYDNLTPGQGKAFNIAAATAHTTIDQMESLALSLPLVAMPGASRVAQFLMGTSSMMAAYGAPAYLEGVEIALQGGADLTGAHVMGGAMAFANAVSELYTDIGIADDVARAMGVKDLVGEAMEQLGATASKRWLRASLAAGKNALGVALEEAGKDEIFGGIGEGAAQAGTWKAIELTNGFTEAPSASEMMAIAGAVLHGGLESVGPTVRETVENFGENFIATLPIALLSGGAAGVSDWKSTHALKTAVTTGKPEDVAKAGEALIDDMRDPEKAAVIDAAAHEARLGKMAADILMSDEGEIGAKLNLAMRAKEQAGSHQKTYTKAFAANKAARQAMEQAQAKLDSGDTSNITLQELNDATEAYAKSSNNMDESWREYQQKKAESDTLHEEALSLARNEAAKQIEQERAGLAQQVQAVQEERAQEQEAKAAAQEEANSFELEADAWIESQHADAPDEQKDLLRQRYIERARQTAQPEAQTETETDVTPEDREKLVRRDRFARNVSERFSVNIAFEDGQGEILRGNRGGYSRSENTIYLPKDATQSDVIRSVFSHELTHRAEQSKHYRALADALLEWKYGDNTVQRDKDRQARYDLYKTQYQNTPDRAAEFEKNGEAIAESEQVARIAEDLFAADEAALDRLIQKKPSVARRIIDTISDFIGKFRGVKDPQLDAMRRAEKYMRKALDEVERKRRSEYRRAVRDANHPGSVQFSVEQLAEATGLQVRRNDDGVPYTLIDRDGNEVKEIKPDMLQETPMGRLIDAAKQAGSIDKKTADSQLKMFADLATLAAQYKDQAMIWEVAGSQLFSAIKSNSDTQYGTTVDFGTICAKTQAIVDVMSETMLKLGRGLSREEVIKTYQQTANVGYNVPCPVCYVFSRWMGVPSLLGNTAAYQDRFTAMSEQEVKDYVSGVEAKYAKEGVKPAKAVTDAKTKLEGKLEKVTRKIQQRLEKGSDMGDLLDEAKALEAEYKDVEAYNWVTQVLCKRDVRDENGQVVLDPEFEPTPKDVLFDLRRTSEFSLYRKNWTYRTTRGAGMGKSILPYSGARIGDTVKGNKDRWGDSENPFLIGDERSAARAIANAKKRMAAQNLIGGQRFQSTSDYRPEWGIDYMMTFLEMQAIGAKGQLYTKVIEAVDMFASAGIETNLSIMGKGNGYHLDENGQPVLGDDDFSSVTGIDYRQAREKTKQYDNVQMILVGLNDTHIRLALASDDITFVIPWHSSGNSEQTLSELMSAVGEQLETGTDYTTTQSDKPVENPNAQQRAAADLRMRILTGELSKGGLSDADRIVLDTNPYIADLYRRFYVDESETETYGIKLSTKQAGQVFPYEYWDTSLSIDQADENGRRFREYCESIGLKPRFPQFADDPGYWKLLIDRRMYNRDGTYHHPQKIDVTGVSISDVAQSVGEVKYGDDVRTNEAVQATLDDIRAALPAEPYGVAPGDVEFGADPIYLGGTENLSADGGADGAGGERSGRQRAGSAAGGTPGDIQHALPEDDLIDQQIDAWIGRRTLPAGNQLTQQRQQARGDGERQFATQTAQRSEAMPDWLKAELYANAEQRYYTRETNDDQLMRAWSGILQNGYEQTRDRLLQLEHMTADDIASANVIMAMAFRNDDMNTAMLMAHKYNTDGTLTAKALQARKLFSRMTPTALKSKVAGQYEAKTAEYMTKHKPAMQDIRRRAKKKADKIRGLQDGDELLRLNAGGYTIDSKNNRWGVPINEQQRALINEYRLGRVPRTGESFYNRATKKQRMLEAILQTPNPLELTGNGLNLIERLEMMKDNLAVVTNADLNYIGRNLALYASMDADMQQGREGDLALSRAYEAYGNIDPATLSEKMRTWGYVSMLLSVPSAIRNVIGNTGQNAQNALADGLAVELDRFVGLFTKERTRAHLTAREKAEGWLAFRDETVNTWRDYFGRDKAVVQRGEERFSLNQRGRVYQNQTLETMRLMEGYLMSVGDRNFWKKKFVNSMAEQMRVADINGVELDYDAAVETAEAEANYATFNEDSRVADLLAQAKRIPGVGWLVHWAMPFTGVPTNIAKRSLQFSPLGLATTAIQLGLSAAKGETFNQRAFVDGMARGLTGTAMWGVGMALMQAGLIHLGTSEDEDDLYNLNTAQGEQYSPFIRVGDEYVSLAAFAPSVSSMIMGAKFAEMLKHDEDKLNAVYNACFASIDQIIDASYLSGLQDFFTALSEGGAAGAMTSIASSAVSQNIPAVLGQIADHLDPYARDTKDANEIMAIAKSAASKIPILREEVLDAKIDITGQKVASKPEWRSFFDPFTTTKVRGDETLDELERLWRDTGGEVSIPGFLIPNTGKITILKAVADEMYGMDYSAGENKLVLTSEQRIRYNELYGQKVFEAITEAMSDPAYQYGSDTEKVEILAALKKGTLQDIKMDVQRQICTDLGYDF